MYGMTLEEAMLCAKLFAYAMGDRSISLSQIDKDSAFALLKRMTDQKWNWSEQQKKQYKVFVDICKNLL